MKDCKFLLPFVKELKEMYPDHKVEWYRSDLDTEYEEIRIDGKTYINTEIGRNVNEIDLDNPSDHRDILFAHIVVKFANVDNTKQMFGLSVNNPYEYIVPPVICNLFCDHKYLRQIFPILLSDNASHIRKVMNNICQLQNIERDFT